MVNVSRRQFIVGLTATTALGPLGCLEAPTMVKMFPVPRFPELEWMIDNARGVHMVEWKNKGKRLHVHDAWVYKGFHNG